MSTQSIFTPLEKEGLTSLKVNYDWQKDKINIIAKKEWETGFDFSTYNSDFFVDSVLTDNFIYLNHQQSLELFKKYDAVDHLNEVIKAVKKGKHIAIECYFHKEKNIRFICNQHNRKQGLNNGYYALLAGGIRRHPLSESELEVIHDGLNLSRAMSLKNVVANVPFGGVKTTVHMDALDLDDFGALGFLAFCMDRCHTFTSPDMYFPVEMSDIIYDKYSVQYIGGRDMPLGTTGKPTAYGLYKALKQATKFLYGSESLAGKSILLQGLGEVGWFVADHVLAEDVKLLISDINSKTIEKLLAQYPGKNIQVVAPEDVLTTKADIFCPCAAGGIFTRENIPTLPFELVFGAANNQLSALSDEEEIELAKLFQQHNILFQTDYINNAAGVICGSYSYIGGKNAKYDVLLEKIDASIPTITWQNLNEAKEKGITPTENIFEYVKEVLYSN